MAEAGCFIKSTLTCTLTHLDSLKPSRTHPQELRSKLESSRAEVERLEAQQQEAAAAHAKELADREEQVGSVCIGGEVLVCDTL